MRPTLPHVLRAHMLERAEACGDPLLRRLLQRAAQPSYMGHPTTTAPVPPRIRPRMREGETMRWREMHPDPPVPRPPPRPPAGTLLDIREVSERLRVLRLVKPGGFRFVPGQHVRVRAGGVSRPYTIVSAPHEPFLELFIQRAEHGELTPQLWQLGPGDRLEISERAKGTFALDARFGRHLMVAASSGIAPFVSMLRHLLHSGRDANRIHVLHGVRFQDELGYADELSAMPPERVRYEPTVSRPDAPRNRGWSGDVGRVETRIEPVLRAHGLRPEDTAVYACGNPGMVTQAEARLAAQGFTVHTEPF